MPSRSDTESWIVRVEGGPAFMANAVAALEWAAQDHPEGSATRAVLQRLAAACAQAMREDTEDREDR